LKESGSRVLSHSLNKYTFKLFNIFSCGSVIFLCAPKKKKKKKKDTRCPVNLTFYLSFLPTSSALKAKSNSWEILVDSSP